MTNTDILKKQMIEALEKTLGVVTQACKKVGISRETHYRWLKDDPDYKQAVEDVDNIALDFVESELFNQIKDGNTTASIFYLKTKGKKRGYIERTEVTGAEGEKIEFKIEVVNSDVMQPFKPE